METKQGGIIASAANKSAKVAKPKTIKDIVNDMMPEIKKALPSTITPERFTRIVLTALSSTPELAKCEKTSFLGAMMVSAQLGLEPNTPEGKAYLIPFKNKNKGIVECNFMLGVYGDIELARRSGVSVDAKVVYENDDFSLEYGLTPDIKHVPCIKGSRGEVIGYYAIWRDNDGAFGFEYMSKEDAEAHGKKYSQTYTSGPWVTNFDAMALKTVIRKALKYAPKSAEYAKAISVDNAVIRADENDLTKDFDIVYEKEEVEEVKNNDEPAKEPASEIKMEV